MDIGYPECCYPRPRRHDARTASTRKRQKAHGKRSAPGANTAERKEKDPKHRRFRVACSPSTPLTNDFDDNEETGEIGDLEPVAGGWT